MCLYVTDLLVTVGLVALAGTAQVMVPTLGALFWKRSTTTGAIAGLIVGITLVICWSLPFIPMTPPGIFAFGGGGLLALLINLTVFIVVSLFTEPRSEELIKEINDQYVEYYEQ
jgi:SSS family solute:Na+ symporter